MNRFTRPPRSVILCLAVCLLFAGAAHAELAKKTRKAAKEFMSQGVLYSRIDIPCKTGRHAFGTYLAPLVEVSPEGANTEGEMGMDASFWHAQSTYWGIAPNSHLKFDDMDFDEGNVEIELVGVGPTDGTDTVIMFTGIHTLDDFKKAFEHAFSRVPLQDEHPDWPEDVRKAIGERRLLEGMNKRQAYYIVGTPERFEKSEEDGKEVETWFLRQDKGMKIGFWTTRAEKSDNPSQLRFVDGKLTGMAQSSSGDKLELDN